MVRILVRVLVRVRVYKDNVKTIVQDILFENHFMAESRFGFILHFLHSSSVAYLQVFVWTGVIFRTVTCGVLFHHMGYQITWVYFDFDPVLLRRNCVG